MTIKTRPFDAANYIRDAQDAALYIEATVEENGYDARAIADALGTIARSRGMGDVAAQTGLSRTSLYKALSSQGNPSFDTVLKICQAMGLTLHITAA